MKRIIAFSIITFVLALGIIFTVQAQNPRSHIPRLVQLVVYEDELLGLDENGDLYLINYRRVGGGVVERGSESHTVEHIQLNYPSMTAGR
jgi:hypothetical protein